MDNPWARRLWPWTPLLLAAVWLVALAVDFRAVVQTIYANADFVSAPVIGELYDERAPGAQVVLGNFPWYETLWFERLTAGLPAHRQIWQLAPWLFSLLGIAATAWATWRAAGRWAAMVVAVALGCAGPALLIFQFGGSLHGPTFTHIALLGAFLVLCATHGGRVGNWWTHVALCALLAALTASGLASDKLLAPGGIAPFVLAAVALLFLLPGQAGRRIAISAVAISAVAGVGARILSDAMKGDHVVAAHFEVLFASFDRLLPNLRLLAHSLIFMFNGDFGGDRLGVRAILELACAAAVLAGAWYAIKVGRDWVRGARPSRAEDPATAALYAHLAFWILAGVLLGATFVLSSVPADQNSARYVLSVGYAVVVLVAIAAASRPRARAFVVVGLSLVLVSGIRGFVRGDIQDNPSQFPTGDISGPLERLAAAERVEHGYAGYWTAAALTWQTKAAVKVYPVKSCTGGPTLCPYTLHRISSWYDPRPATRSLLVIDPAQLSAGGPRETDPAFGAPERVSRIGRTTVYVYGYDIAAKFAR